MDASQPEDERDRRLGAAIDGYFEALERGESIEVAVYSARFPELAGELRESLETLLVLRSREEGTGAVAAAPAAPGEDAGVQVPGYRILGLLGRGGMGVVYRALQGSTKRVVALKFLAAGASSAARRRFEREIELAAALDHPGIVRVLESGEAGGRLYCAMEFVDGQPLHGHLARHALPLAERLRLFLDVAEAVHHAHLRAVVHRDLKPSNIMVDAAGRARILDFGLARFMLAEEELASDGTERRITREGQVVGTLPYLSPEQASGRGQIDLRSDVHALGVILFEMLTGRLPFDAGGGLRETLDRICTATPPRPSRFEPAIGRDLDAVVLKALEKSKESRYQSAAELAEDVRAYLRGEPVEANRGTRFYLLRKTYARHRRGFLAAAAVLALVLVASAVVLVLYLRLRRDQALLRDELHRNELRTAAVHLAAGDDLLAESLLFSADQREPDERTRWSLTCWAIQNPRLERVVGVGWTTAIAVAPDGSTLAHGNLEGRLVLRPPGGGDGRVLAEHAHAGGVRELAFAGDGGVLASLGADGWIRLWEPRERRAIGELGDGGAASGPLFVPGTAELLYGTRSGELRWRSLAPGSEERTLWKDLAARAIQALDRTGDGSVVLACQDEIIRVDAAGGETRARWSRAAPIETLRCGPDGSWIALWSAGKLCALDLATGTERWSVPAGLSEPRPLELWDFPASTPGAPTAPHVPWLPRVLFSPDGELLVATGWDAVVRVFRAADGERLGALRAHDTAVYSAGFLPASRHLAVGCVGTLRVWDLDRQPGVASRPAAEGTRTCAAVTADGRTIAWTGAPGNVLVAARESFPVGGPVRSLATGSGGIAALCFDPSGFRLATADREGSIALWSTEDLARRAAWSSGEREVRALAFAPDARWLASAGSSGRIRLWDPRTGEPVAGVQAHAGQVLALVFSADGRWLASGGTDWKARVFEVPTVAGRPELVQRGERGHLEWVNALAFSPDGEVLATGGADLTIRIGPPAGEDAVRTLRIPHAHWITALCFLERGRVLASGGYDGALRFWDASSGEDLGSVPSHGGPVETLSASADGRLLVVGASRAVQLVDLDSAARVARR